MTYMNRKTYTPSPPRVIIPLMTCIKYAGFYGVSTITMNKIYVAKQLLPNKQTCVSYSNLIYVSTS